MPDGGTIRIAVSCDGETVSITVQDTGCGIPKEYLPTLFDLFVTHKKNGTGLGLAICREIAEAHRGSDFRNVRAGAGLRLHRHASCSVRTDTHPYRPIRFVHKKRSGIICCSADRFRIAFIFRCTYTDFYILILCLCFVVVLFFIFFFFHLLYLCLFLRQIKRRTKAA